MKYILIILVLFSTGAFAKRKKKISLYIEPTVGYAMYTKDTIQVANLPTANVGHYGLTFGGKVGLTILL